jgi:hypothetical protein
MAASSRNHRNFRKKQFVGYIIMRTLNIRLSDWWCSVKASEFLQNGFCILHHNEALDIRLSEWCCSVKASEFLQNGFCILHHNEALDIRLSHWWCSVKASEFLQNGLCIIYHNEDTGHKAKRLVL